MLITALFTGMVLALQTGIALARFGAKPYVGSVVGLSLARELGPVLTALMVGGRVGAGITAEIGAMQVTEQVDAIRSMGADPVQKLVLPRVLAATLALPLLTVLADVLGVFGGLRAVVDAVRHRSELLPPDDHQHRDARRLLLGHRQDVRLRLADRDGRLLHGAADAPAARSASDARPRARSWSRRSAC